MELVNAMVYWINCVPQKDGVHPTLSPRAIMTGQQLTSKHVEFQFGDFLQAVQPPGSQNTGNTMDERTSDAIYCMPSGNSQGGYWVYRMSTNRIVHRNQATLAHTGDTVIQHLDEIAINQSAPEGLEFGDRYNNITSKEEEELEQQQHLDDLGDYDYNDDDEEELPGDHELDEDIFHDTVEQEEIDDPEIIDPEIGDPEFEEDPEVEANDPEEIEANDSEDAEEEINFEQEDTDPIFDEDHPALEQDPAVERRSTRESVAPTLYSAKDVNNP